jgi:hypothetical protein
VITGLNTVAGTRGTGRGTWERKTWGEGAVVIGVSAVTEGAAVREVTLARRRW